MQNAPEIPEAPVEEATVVNLYGVKAAPSKPAPPPASTSHRALIPQRGTVFDRLGPALILGMLLLAIAASSSRLTAPITPRAVATETSALDTPGTDAQAAPGNAGPASESAGGSTP
jgi:hypothetical protein